MRPAMPLMTRARTSPGSHHRQDLGPPSWILIADASVAPVACSSISPVVRPAIDAHMVDDEQSTDFHLDTQLLARIAACGTSR